MSLVKISINYLEDVNWLSASSRDFNISGHTDVWRVNISNNLVRLDSLSSLINAEEKARAKRYLQLRDKNRFIIGRAALRIILGGYLNKSPAEIEFEIGSNKKPFLKNSALRYNVSHSGDWIFIGVSGSEIGVDIEWIDPAFDYHDIMGEYFSPEEAKYITEDHSRFFMLWTRKEALTKATAKGLDDDLKLIPALQGEQSVEGSILKSTADWQVNSFELSPGYLASVATAEQNAIQRFWDIDLSKNNL
jgi:4'-phosphopantetheinyl transferase